MQLFLVENNKNTRPLYLFLNKISASLYSNIVSKLQSYCQHGDVYSSKSLKTLNARIWKYKGTIYKLRVDNGAESARVLFVKTQNGDIVVIHGFLKSSRKTPVKEARQAITVFQLLQACNRILWNSNNIVR